MVSLQAFISLFYSVLSCKDELPGLVMLPIQLCSAFVCLFSKSDPAADLARTIWHALPHLFISRLWCKKDSQFIYNNIADARMTHSMTHSLWLTLWFTVYDSQFMSKLTQFKILKGIKAAQFSFFPSIDSFNLKSFIFSSHSSLSVLVSILVSNILAFPVNLLSP